MHIKDRSEVYLYSITVCMGSFIFGYELTSFSHLQNLLINISSYSSMTVLFSLFPLAAIFGAVASKSLTSAMSYIDCFQLLDYLTIIGCLLGASALSLKMQIVSRLLLGWVVGVNTVVIPTYLTSCLPGSMGGPAGTLNQLFITIGIFIGFASGFLVIDGSELGVSWRLLVLIPILPALIRIYTTSSLFPYQTVEYMIDNHMDQSLSCYIHHFFERISVQDFKQQRTMAVEDMESESAPMFDPLSAPFNARFRLACFIVVFNQLSGSSLMFVVASQVFPLVVGWEQEEILKSFCLLTLLQVVITFISGQFLEKYGRRSFMLEGQRLILIALILSLFGELAAFEIREPLQYIVIFLHMVGFSLSFGPCSFLIGTELLYDVTYPSVMLWVSGFLFSVLSKELVEYYGFARLMLFYLLVSFVGFIYVAVNLVETQGKSRKEVYRQFREGSTVRTLHWNRFLTKRNTVGKEEELHQHLLNSERK